MKTMRTTSMARVFAVVSGRHDITRMSRPDLRAFVVDVNNIMDKHCCLMTAMNRYISEENFRRMNIISTKHHERKEFISNFFTPVTRAQTLSESKRQ
jgi:hypothetical protein